MGFCVEGRRTREKLNETITLMKQKVSKINGRRFNVDPMELIAWITQFSQTLDFKA